MSLSKIKNWLKLFRTDVFENIFTKISDSLSLQSNKLVYVIICLSRRKIWQLVPMFNLIRTEAPYFDYFIIFFFNICTEPILNASTKSNLNS